MGWKKANEYTLDAATKYCKELQKLVSLVKRSGIGDD